MVAVPNFAYEPRQWEIEAEMLQETPPKSALLAQPRPRAANTALHGDVLKILAGVNASILAAFWMALSSDREALFMVAISAFYLFVYMGTPYMMGRVGGKHLDASMPLHQFLKEPFETWTGIITGREAMIQVLLVPAAIATAVMGMCLIIASHQ